jgi:glycosyltransferase involved in cell wall biosynthesis
MSRLTSHLVAVHLLNDRSGSPLVFRHALRTLAADGATIDLLTATPGPSGFLSDLPDVRLHALPYRRFQWTPLTLLAFLWTQLVLFGRVWRLTKPDSVVYVNTLLPAGAALAGWLRGAQVVYHLHEVSVRPALLKRVLLAVARLTATRALCVSEYLRTALALPTRQQEVVYNALDTDFCHLADTAEAPSDHPFTVLMACSLRDYKGVPEFYALAAALPAFRFELVLNASPMEVARYRAAHALPGNLTVFPGARVMHSFYQRASVVVNLSRPDEWVETFGMTVLEAMRYGRPVIVPPVGGVGEVIRDGVTGFAIDGRNLAALCDTINRLHADPAQYQQIGIAARRRAATFSADRFETHIRHSFRAVAAAAQSSIAPHSTPQKMSTKIAIIGSVGLPACYGGFETLAAYLVKYLQPEHELTVYCSGTKYPKEQRTTHFEGAKLVYVPLNANGIQSIPYDCLSILHALFYADVLLILGVPGAIMLPFVKWFTNKKVIVSIDGIEWRRDKWSKAAKWYLRFAEKLAVRYSHADIADNDAIQNYTARAYSTRSRVIEYGGDHTVHQPITDAYAAKYPFLVQPYAFKVCRIEPENNVHLILEAFAELPRYPFVMIGNWANSPYGQRLKAQYADYSNIHLLDPIYDQAELDVLRGNCYVYIHGHSAGGTNPSLVEAMYLSLPILAFDVSFNKATTEQKALYFHDKDSLRHLITHTSIAAWRELGTAMQAIAQRRYKWEVIARKYNYLIRQVTATMPKGALTPQLSKLDQQALLKIGLGQYKSLTMFYEDQK